MEEGSIGLFKYRDWGFYEMDFICKNISKDKKQELVWVPRKAIALWSRPGSKFTEDLWDIGIIIEQDIDGNAKVLVNGKLEYMHVNHIRPVVGNIFDHKDG